MSKVTNESNDNCYSLHREDGSIVRDSDQSEYRTVKEI